MKTTEYFRNSVLSRRPYSREQWITFVLANLERKEIQGNGRIRYWAFVPELGKYLRVVTEADGETINNAFPDRGFHP